jgi:hypothetical protein
MRFALLLLTAVGLMAGCLDDSPAAEASADDVDPASGSRGDPYVVFRQPFMDAYATGSVTRDFTLDESVSSLQITVEFGTSAFTNFQITSPDACAGLDSGAGVYPNSSQWMGSCDGLPAGTHTLAWTTQGTAQGTITVTAVP